MNKIRISTKLEKLSPISRRKEITKISEIINKVESRKTI